MVLKLINLVSCLPFLALFRKLDAWLRSLLQLPNVALILLIEAFPHAPGSPSHIVKHLAVALCRSRALLR